MADHDDWWSDDWEDHLPDDWLAENSEAPLNHDGGLLGHDDGFVDLSDETLFNISDVDDLPSGSKANTVTPNAENVMSSNKQQQIDAYQARIKDLHSHISSDNPDALNVSHRDIIHPDVLEKSEATHSEYTHDGEKLKSPRGDDFKVREDIKNIKKQEKDLDYIRNYESDPKVIADNEKQLAEARDKLLERSKRHAAAMGEAMPEHHGARQNLSASLDTELKRLEKTKEEALAAAKAAHSNGNSNGLEDATKAITKRYEEAVGKLKEAHVPQIEGHTTQISQMGNEFRNLEEATGHSLTPHLGKGVSVLESAEKEAGRKFGSGAAVANEAEQSGKFLGSKILGGVKSGISKNWNKETGGAFAGKVKVAAGALLMLDAGRRIVSDISGMLGGEKGLDKNGEPLPSPGIMNLAFDAGEGTLGAFVASTKFFRPGRG